MKASRGKLRRFRVRSEYQNDYSVFIEGYSNDTEPIPDSVLQDLRLQHLGLRIENLGGRLEFTAIGDWHGDGHHADEIVKALGGLGFVEDPAWEYPGYGERSTWWPDA